ncbi:GspH/FimT family protein [Pseudomonas sp. OE 28.3]|uniref:GspH/FimT family pseudopilin n=1 Tax=Pseudomonas sp. OE 28.3 TaxID=2745519 RepID=UPI001644F314|nr:GspH/FimT family protein [Pseudomonas sp. OE 28.3]QXI60122.1 GspH/FimT family protein [Pseudomonas sp. OE 28.3]
MQQRGFTLIELLFGLLLGGILVTVAVPAFKGLLASQQQRSAAQSLAEGLRLARTEAITRNRAVIIQALENDWSRGWQIIVDTSGRGEPGTDNPILLERQGNGRVLMAGNGPVKSQVRFSGLGEPVFAGGGFRAGTVHICGTDPVQSLYQVVLAPSGRISLRSEATEQALCGSGTVALRAANEPAALWAWRT